MYHLRVPTHKLRTGMVISSTVYTNSGVTLLPEGTQVTKDVMSLLANHMIEFVNVAYEMDNVVVKLRDEAPRTSKKSQHFKNFKKTFKIAEEDISNSMNDIVFKNEEVDINFLTDSLNSIINKSKNSLDLCDMLYYMKETSSSIYSHCLNVALIGELLGKWMKLSDEDIHTIGICGLLHDIGKLKLPQHILDKKDPLTVAEQTHFEKHAILGYNILKEKNIEHSIKHVALTHHERLDGNGYPLKIRDSEISIYARIIAIADTYDTMTSASPNRAAMSPFEVVHFFESNGYGKFDVGALMTFLVNILNNFVHYTVELNNGEKAEVVFINSRELSRPIVRCGTSFVDLSIRKDLSIVKIFT